MGKRKTHEQYVIEVAKINSNIEVIDKYMGVRVNILHHCKICNHYWKPKPTKILQGTGCPACDKQNKISKSELKVYFYIKKYFSNTIWGYQDKQHNLTELDVYIPSLRIGFEFDGAIYHQNIERDKRKDNICKNLKIKLVRIREYGCPKYNSSCTFIYLPDLSQEKLRVFIIYILEALGVQNPEVDFSKDAAQINELITYKHRANSLLERFPEIAAEWHPTKNGKLAPKHINCNSHDKVWWICSKCGYEWEREVYRRTDGNRGCPKCACSGVPKAVYCLELDQLFHNASTAGKATSVNSKNINTCCRGKFKSAGKHPSTGEKLHWFFVEDQIDKSGNVIQGAITLKYITQQQFNMFLNETI